MQNHAIVSLIQKIELQYAKEIQKYFASVKKTRIEKLYKLISTAKNADQLERSLLFKKLFSKTYSEKNDYLWRNEIRLLKEELESFLINMEHLHHSKNNDAYNNWMLIQAFDRLKFTDGIDEKHDELIKSKDDFASYNYVIDASFIQLNNLHHKITDLTKRMEIYPTYINEAKVILTDVISTYVERLNVYISQHNWLCYHHQSNKDIALLSTPFSINLQQNPISKFYQNYALSFTTNFELQIKSLETALENIETIYTKNKLLQENRFLVYMSKGRELSANGYFLEAHETLSKIKPDTDKVNLQVRTAFYVNYITNLVKSNLYKDALYTLDNEFSTDNILYKNMLLQSRLLCYLNLRDTKNFEKYISYDLDVAPFPQNYMLKVIKSAYFYLIGEFDTAIAIISSLLHAKYATESMLYYKPISTMYKKLYSAAQKNILQKKWNIKDVESLKNDIIEFEKTSPVEFKQVSVYLWLKKEIEYNLI